MSSTTFFEHFAHRIVLGVYLQQFHAGQQYQQPINNGSVGSVRLFHVCQWIPLGSLSWLFMAPSFVVVVVVAAAVDSLTIIYIVDSSVCELGLWLLWLLLGPETTMTVMMIAIMIKILALLIVMIIKPAAV
jgi:hypothetical protein